jgi:hypothetical protein
VRRTVSLPAPTDRRKILNIQQPSPDVEVLTETATKIGALII